ncbi:MAG: hypothetical protein Q8S11_04960 [Daejeonella sp.]|uniref:hypothetical protein n=1 Tax=Daejeonella sp. TaxID=2805397 RepID=UPI0027335DB4|nr:hypothetical protein [Daejeonella sp.]MDP3467659.1 hypothetical protein [Daejeonella sp.]
MKAVFNTFVLIFAIIAIRPVMAQQNSVQGLIMERSGASRISGVNILNKNTGNFTFSNELGLFRIMASVGDTLSLSKSGYSDLILPILELSDKVLMLQPVISLSEVKVMGQSKKQELDEVRDQYRKKGSYYAGKPPLLAYFFRPLTALYELIGKTPAQARRFNAYYIKELQESEVDRRFSAYAIKNVTGLEGNDLKNFMILYRPEYQNVANFDEYALINYIKKSLQMFNDAGRPTAIRSLPPLPKAPDLSEKNLRY